MPFKPRFADPNLPHQFVLRISRGKIRVSCNCLGSVTPAMKGGGRVGFTFMKGDASDFASAQAIYRDPANHNPRAAPFSP